MYQTLIDVDSLTDHLGNANYVIVDCRFDLSNPQWGREEYLTSHVSGALYAHLDDDLSGPPITNKGRHPLPTTDKLVALFGRLGIDGAKQVVVYDSSGGSICARLWWLLRYMGHEAVAVLDGGWQAYSAAGAPLRSGDERTHQTEYRGEPQADRVISVDDVPSVPLLVDSRDPARYRGEIEPLDPVAGHIPGAVNHFWKDNLDDRSKFVPVDRLRRSFQALLGDTASEGAVFYCGSGVTACHNILAMVHAGFKQPRLYGGSWSEWCADRDRPVATGGE